MRAFEPFKNIKFYHPEDMNIIIDYLEATGKLNIGYKELEDMYYDYSSSVCCGWRCVDEESLEQFASFLARAELTQCGYRLLDYEED